MFRLFLQIFPCFSHFFVTLACMQCSIIPASEIVSGGLSWWQSSSWADILVLSWQAQEVFYYGDISSTYLLIEIRSIWLGFFGAFSLGVSSCQIGSDWEEFLIELQKELKSRNILFLQIEPIDTEIKSENIQKPYKKFLTPHTRILDLSLAEDALLAQMHEKWRYNIRLAMKRGVEVDRVMAITENIDIWMSLLTDTLSRDRFSGNSRSYYETFVDSLEQSNQWWLYFARFEGRVIAAGIFVFTPGRAIYYYGASSSSLEDRKQMAPYLLQWTAIREAKNRNIPVYDFLGVADPIDPTDSLRWVTDFKEKFGGTRMTLPSKILLPMSWKYRIFVSIQTMKNLLKRKYMK